MCVLGGKNTQVTLWKWTRSESNKGRDTSLEASTRSSRFQVTNEGCVNQGMSIYTITEPKSQLIMFILSRPEWEYQVTKGKTFFNFLCVSQEEMSSSKNGKQSFSALSSMNELPSFYMVCEELKRNWLQYRLLLNFPEPET